MTTTGCENKWKTKTQKEFRNARPDWIWEHQIDKLMAEKYIEVDK